MKIIICCTLLILSFSVNINFAFNQNANARESSNKKNEYFNTFYPTSKNTRLIYQSSFGETTSYFVDENDEFISKNEGSKFKYIQSIKVTDNGVFVTKTYQYFKLLLFLSKEKLFSYSKPLLRLPLPLIPGETWTWKGDEYSDGDTSQVLINGKIFDQETIKTPAGIFKAIKVVTTITSSAGSDNVVNEWYAENIGLVKAQISIGGGGLMKFVRDVLGYNKIEFELKEIIND